MDSVSGASSVRHGLRLRPFFIDEFPAAMQVFRDGYPETPEKFWRAGLERLKKVPPSRPDAPLGAVLEVRGVSKGVVIGLQGKTSREGASCNFSSWFIERSARLHALWMARELCSDPSLTYTLLTPVSAVRRLFVHVPFRAVSHQAVVVWTPKAAWPAPQGEPILDANATLSRVVDVWTVKALEDHLRLGCLVCGIATDDGVVPLVFRRRSRVRWLPLLELIFAPSTPTLLAHIQAVSRFLLQQGWLCFEFEAHEDQDIDVPCTRLFRRRFARGAYDTNGINHLYSELVYLGVN